MIDTRNIQHTGRAFLRGVGRWWPECLLVAAALATFLSFLGRTQLWGRREERVAAEVADTVRHGNWLVARLQNRPRLKKPPLPRWCSAGVILLTGRMDEASLRLPYALAALATVAVVYFWGRGLGGRQAGLAASWILTTTTLFVVEMRQASADSLLVLLVTASLWFFWMAHRSRHFQRSYSLPEIRSFQKNRVSFAVAPLCLALSGLCAGLGILAKGPIALCLIMTGLVGYLWVEHGSTGWRRLLGWTWWLALLAVALPWPVLVLLHHPQGGRVWWREASIQLATTSEPRRMPLLVHFFEMSLPWAPLAVVGVVIPLRRPTRSANSQLAAVAPAAIDRGGLWLCWWWCVGSLLILSCWRVAKTSYYVPCLPGVALLAGLAWRRLSVELQSGRLRYETRIALAIQWALIALGLPGAAIVVAVHVPEWSAQLAAAVVLSLVTAAVAWVFRRGPAALPLLAAPHVLLVFGAVGWFLPSFNQLYSHKDFAQLLAAASRQGAIPLGYLREPNESIWFYLDQTLRRVNETDRLIKILNRSGRPLLLVLNHSEYKMLCQDDRVSLRVLEREDKTHRRANLILAQAELPNP